MWQAPGLMPKLYINPTQVRVRRILSGRLHSYHQAVWERPQPVPSAHMSRHDCDCLEYHTLRLLHLLDIDVAD
jgi:hypothetical protein